MMMKKLVSLQGLLCSALLVACVPLPLQGFAAETGTLRGRFVYGATPPKRDKLNVNKDQDVCGAFNLRSEQLVVAEDGAMRDVIIYARKMKGPKTDADAEPVVLDNKDCRFAPHVVALRPGQTLLVKNSDSVAHNTDIKFSSNSAVNEGLPPSATKEFTGACRKETNNSGDYARRTPTTMYCFPNTHQNTCTVTVNKPGTSKMSCQCTNWDFTTGHNVKISIECSQY